MSDPVLEELLLRVANLERDRIRIIEAEVTAVDETAGTFDVLIPGETEDRHLAGVSAAAFQFMPAVTDIVRLAVAGAQPVHQPTSMPGIDVNNVGTLAGANIIDDPTIMGDAFTTHLARKAQVVARTTNWAALGSATTSEAVMTELQFETTPGHQYEVRATGMQADVNGADKGAVAFHLRYTTDGTAPGPASTLMGTAVIESRFDASPWENPTAAIVTDFVETNATSRTVRVAVTIRKMSPGLTSVNLYIDNTYTQRHFTITDLGIAPPDTGGSGSTSGEEVFEATWHRNYTGSLVQFSESRCYQGENPNGTGNARSFVGFPNMQTAMAGKTVTYCKLWTHWPEWYELDGGYPVLSVHTNLNPPASATGQVDNRMVWDGGLIPRGGGFWWNLPLAWGQAFAAGTWRGVCFGPAFSTDFRYHGKASGSSASSLLKPKIAIGWRT